jgi:predicted nucleic acid-binding protein
VKIFLDANLLIYMNASSENSRRIYDDFYTELASTNRLFTNVLVLDELLYISKKKYNVPYSVTVEFIENVVLPFTEVLQLGLPEYLASAEIVLKTRLKLSDALHVASMRLNGISTIASEDREFDNTMNLDRVWVPS